MITLVDDQDVPGYPGMAVIVGGDYEDTALVSVYNKGDDTKSPQVQFQAQYISLGEKVYQ